MNKFTIESNLFLKQPITAFFHTNFYGTKANNPSNPDYLYRLKNDPHHCWTDYQLRLASTQLADILRTDLPKIQQDIKINNLTVCVVPRAKADTTYRSNQLLFRATVQKVVNELNGFEDGTNYIIRHTNTRTTHLRKPIEGYNNDGALPYQGITIKTCNISLNVQGKDILLIDDIYTKTVNVDEDVIQTLLTKGAKSVTFYAIGLTVGNYN